MFVIPSPGVVDRCSLHGCILGILQLICIAEIGKGALGEIRCGAALQAERGGERCLQSRQLRR